MTDDGTTLVFCQASESTGLRATPCDSGPTSISSTYWEFREADFEASGFGPYTLAVAGEQAMAGTFGPFDGTVELDITGVDRLVS